MLDFPNSPVLNETYRNDWRWDGDKWVRILGDTGVWVAPIPPTNPKEGAFWYDTTINKLKLWVGGAWVDTGSSVTVSNTAPSNGGTGDLWFASNISSLSIFDSTKWILVNFPDAPDDGKLYLRGNRQWTALEEQIPVAQEMMVLDVRAVAAQAFAAQVWNVPQLSN